MDATDLANKLQTCSVCLFVGGEKRVREIKWRLGNPPTSIISVAGRPTTAGLPADLHYSCPFHQGWLPPKHLPPLLDILSKERLEVQ